jgi:hypothetical protein
MLRVAGEAGGAGGVICSRNWLNWYNNPVSQSNMIQIMIKISLNLRKYKSILGTSCLAFR